MSKKVLVMTGGFSAEREVSLVSGQGVVEALKEKGYDVVSHDLKNIPEFIRVLQKEKPDAVFNALHGNWGEDGEIQGFLDMLQVPYTHSGMRASAIGMDKFLTKLLAKSNGIKIADDEKMTYASFKKNGPSLDMPYVVKPVADGSSVGVFIIRSEDDLKKVHYESDDEPILIEKYIEGRELTCAVLDGKALAVTELCAKAEFYNYEAKYTNGVTTHILPAQIPEDVEAVCMRYAECLHQKLGCNTVSRCDFRYNPEDGVVLLEINTAPGLTPLSLVPEQAKYRGISYGELCAKLVENAACRKLPDVF